MFSGGAQIGQIGGIERFSNVALYEKMAVTGGLAGRVDLWSVPELQHQAQFTLPTSRPISAVSFSPDGEHIAAGAMGRHTASVDSRRNAATTRRT